MTRKITLVLAVALLAVPVLALTLGGALNNLEADLDARITAIGPDPTWAGTARA